MTYLPSKQPAGLTVPSAGIPVLNLTGTEQTVASLTVPRTGQYMVCFDAVLGTNGGGSNVHFSLYVNSVLVWSNTGAYGNSSAQAHVGGFWQGAITSGQNVRLAASNPGGQANQGTTGGSLAAAFIPTPGAAQ